MVSEVNLQCLIGRNSAMERGFDVIGVDHTVGWTGALMQCICNEYK